MLKQYVDRQDDENFSRDIVEVSVIDVEARRMLETGIIEPSTSPYTSLIVIVKKKDVYNRFCIDIRAINRITVLDEEMITWAGDKCMQLLAGSKYVSKFDLCKGYLQYRTSWRNVKMQNSFSDTTRTVTVQGYADWFGQRVSQFQPVNAKTIREYAVHWQLYR